jgi:hypothetical protein
MAMSELKTVKIKNNRIADIELPAALVAPKDPRERSTRVHQSRRLVPGLNIIPGDYYAMIKDHPGVKALFETMLDDGKPMLEIAKADDKTGLAAKSTAGLSLEKASVMINACNDVTILEAWAASDTRREVLDTIIARMELLEEGGKEAKRGS